MQARQKMYSNLTSLWQPPIQPRVEIDDFAELLRSGKHYIDKSSLVTRCVNPFQKVFCIDYPAKSGKSINLSMLKYFFGHPEYSYLFNGLNISFDSIYQHQGKHKVLHFDFNIFKDKNEKQIIKTYQKFISTVYNEHHYLIDSGDENKRSHLNYDEIKFFSSIINGTANYANYIFAFNQLIKYIYDERRKRNEEFQRPIILIDNADALTMSNKGRDFAASFLLLVNSDIYNKLIVVGDKQTHAVLSHIKTSQHLNEDYERTNEYFGCSESEMIAILKSKGIESTETPKPDFHYRKYYSYESEEQIPSHGTKASDYSKRYYIEVPAYLPNTVLQLLEKNNLNNNTLPQLK